MKVWLHEEWAVQPDHVAVFLEEKAYMDPVSPIPTPSPATTNPIVGALGNLLTTIDVKALAGVVAACLALIAGRAGWAWLTPDLSDKIAMVIVAKGLGALAAHAHVAGKQLDNSA